ncbi:MAG TPA: D-erythronate dehydrogenase [Casimicrobiaceae bacterium]|nr:D-erythronate dehydrogenase [Casimicrobiaceae bacterium]
MRIVITGAAGFLGSRLAAEILERGALVDTRGERRDVTELVLVDLVRPTLHDPRVVALEGNLDDARVVDAAITPATNSVFHLAAVVSAQAEADFDLGMRVNVDATRRVLERCRLCTTPPKVVFASSLAVFGGALADPVPDDAPVTPRSSYGTQKAIGELLVADMTRKGFIDGRALRLPTIVVRPGKPNQAASSFASGIIREPLAGVVATCPVGRKTRMWIQSPRAVVDNLLVGHDAAARELPATRAVNVPGLCVGVDAMVDALRRVAGDDAASRVHWNYDAAIDRIVSTWPARFTADAGRALGMRADADFESIVRAHIDASKPS